MDNLPESNGARHAQTPPRHARPARQKSEWGKSKGAWRQEANRRGRKPGIFLIKKQANRPQRPSMLRSALSKQEKSVDNLPETGGFCGVSSG
ncbi:MAG: hypothetical protein ACTTJV_04425 [Ottowia sp.]